jgi:RIO kinase 1
MMNFYRLTDTLRGELRLAQQGPNCQRNSTKMLSYQPSDKLFKKFTNKINVEKYEGPSNLSGTAASKLIESNKKTINDRYAEYIDL